MELLTFSVVFSVVISGVLTLATIIYLDYKNKNDY